MKGEEWSGVDEPSRAPHKPARPMKVVMDRSGNLWLCDADADESSDLRAQGCWNCGELAFTRND
jgi:hypothetical protein